jgi:hypothetical protein
MSNRHYNESSWTLFEYRSDVQQGCTLYDILLDPGGIGNERQPYEATDPGRALSASMYDSIFAIKR